jgi:3-hydroxyisobutyrate dehydrogenase-like beta-hydroxyacid dehydrogenase
MSEDRRQALALAATLTQTKKGVVMAQQIGFIGLGAMGLPMASNLIKAGYSLKVYNRTASKADPLVRAGAELVSSPEQTAGPGAIVVSMLSDDAALESVVVGVDTIADRLAPDGIHVSMSTVAPATARRLADYHAIRRSAYVAAPVFGRPEAAQARKLWICVSGPDRLKKKVRPILDAMGQGVFDLGEEIGAANALKLAGNFLIGAAMESMAEAFAMAEKSGIDRVKAAEMLTSTLFACPVYQGYGLAIARLTHEPAGFRLKLGLKDLELVLATASEVRAPMPVAAIVRDRLLSAVAREREALDWSALALGAREDAGLK